MPRSIDHRATSSHPPEPVYTAMVDRDLLEERLRHLGGPGAAVTSYETTSDGVRYTLRHGIASADLPSVVRNLIRGGDLKIDRTEEWKDTGDGRYDGTGSVVVVGTPATARSVMRVDGDGGSGSQIRIRAEVTVKVPLLGSKIEEAVAGQIEQLLSAETAFTLTQVR